eukprot:5709073-Pleurochrysis_carterae.AAC.4
MGLQSQGSFAAPCVALTQQRPFPCWCRVQCRQGADRRHCVGSNKQNLPVVKVGPALKTQRRVSSRTKRFRKACVDEPSLQKRVDA